MWSRVRAGITNRKGSGVANYFFIRPIQQSGRMVFLVRIFSQPCRQGHRTHALAQEHACLLEPCPKHNCPGYALPSDWATFCSLVPFHRSPPLLPHLRPPQIVEGVSVHHNLFGIIARPHAKCKRAEYPIRRTSLITSSLLIRARFRDAPVLLGLPIVLGVIRLRPP